MFQALEPVPHRAADRLGLTASIARAAAGTGNRDLFRRAWTQVVRLNKDADVQAVVPACMLDLALGAASLGEWDRAESAAEEANELATKLGQAKIRFRAEALLDADPQRAPGRGPQQARTALLRARRARRSPATSSGAWEGTDRGCRLTGRSRKKLPALSAERGEFSLCAILTSESAARTDHAALRQTTLPSVRVCSPSRTATRVLLRAAAAAGCGLGGR